MAKNSVTTHHGVFADQAALDTAVPKPSNGDLATIDTGLVWYNGATWDLIDSAPDDMTGAEIKVAYEAEADTNAYDDAAVSKLGGIEALADVTDEINVLAALDGATISNATVATGDKIMGQDVNDSSNIKTFTAQSIANLKVTELSEDTSPVLAGDLALNSNDLTGSGNINPTGDVTPSGKVSIGGALETPPSVSAAGAYTWLATDLVLLKTGITASGDNVTMLASPNDGAHAFIRDSGGNCNGTDIITIQGNGNNIEGSGTYVLNTANASIHLVYYATANTWYILSEQ